jgi:hypothetical protein
MGVISTLRARHLSQAFVMVLLAVDLVGDIRSCLMRCYAQRDACDDARTERYGRWYMNVVHGRVRVHAYGLYMELQITRYDSYDDDDDDDCPGRYSSIQLQARLARSSGTPWPAFS